MTSKERSMAVLQGQKADRTPVAPLMMFFAADRVGVSYKQYVLESEAQIEAQLNLHENYFLDILTACSDSYLISVDVGGQAVYPENQTPHLVQPIVKTEKDFKAIKRPDCLRPGSRMKYQIDIVEKLVKARGEQALIMGWIEMPFAEACNWCGISAFLEMLYEAPTLAHEILTFITDITIEFVLAQLEAGAPIIGCGDAAASLLSVPMFKEFALPYEQRVNAAIKVVGGMTELHICGNTSHIMQNMSASDADLYTIDHMVDFAEACRIYSAAEKTVKANVNPVSDLMQATPQEAMEAAHNCNRIAKGLRYMLSAGCEIPAATPDEVYFAFVDTVLNGL